MSDLGTALWVLFVLSPCIVIVQQIRRYQTKRPYSWQPIQGERGVVAPGEVPTLTMPLLCQFALLGGSIAALAINEWGTYVEGSYEADLGLITYQDASGSTTLMQCSLNLQYYRMYYRINYVAGDILSGTDCFTIVGSSIMVFIFMVISVLIALYQFALMQPWINFRSCVVTASAAPGGVRSAMQDESSGITPGLWVRGYVYMVIQGCMSLLYGICVALCGGVFPGPSYWILLAVAALSRLQYFLLEIYIKALPPPHPDGQIGFAQCDPKPVMSPVLSVPAINILSNGPAAAAALEMGIVPAPPMPALHAALPYGHNPFYPHPYNSPAFANWIAAARYYPPVNDRAPMSQPPVALHLQGPSVSPASAAAVTTNSVAPGVPADVEGGGGRYVVSSGIPPTAAAAAPNGVSAPVPSAAGSAALVSRFAKVCASCNHPSEREGAAFCSSCGSRLPQ